MPPVRVSCSGFAAREVAPRDLCDHLAALFEDPHWERGRDSLTELLLGVHMGHESIETDTWGMCAVMLLTDDCLF